jgi:adenylate cyclase
MTRDIRRHEFEYEIPLHDAEFMILHMCQGSVIKKDRHLVKIDHHIWEIDEFYGDNAGLIVAEIELSHEQEAYTRPCWAGQEVSTDTCYFNMSLVNNPYKNWTT